MSHLEEDARREFLRVYRRYGRIGPAADAADVDRRTVTRWKETDPAFAQCMAECELEVTDELAVKGIQALREAPLADLLRLPTLYFHEMSLREPDRRQNAKVEVNVGIMNAGDWQQAARAVHTVRADSVQLTAEAQD